MRDSIKGLLLITFYGILVCLLRTGHPVFTLRDQFPPCILFPEFFSAVVILANDDLVHGDTRAARDPTLAHYGSLVPRSRPTCRSLGCTDARAASKRLLHVNNEALIRGHFLVCLDQSLVIRRLVVLLTPLRCI